MIVQQTTAHGHDYGRTSVHIVQKHTKNTVCYIPAFWHKSGPFCIGGCFFIFSSIQGANEPESTSISHSTNANQCCRTTHHPHPLKTQQTLYLSHFYSFLLIFAIEIISTNSTRITFISFTFDCDSFYFCLLFHCIQPYLYPFIQTK